MQARSDIRVDHPELVRGRRVLVVEDGPTLTHGERSYVSGAIAAQACGAPELVDPRPYAIGSLRACFERYPWIGRALPVEGYSAAQFAELQETIGRTPCDAVVVATPVNLSHVISIRQPCVRVTYTLVEITRPDLAELADRFLDGSRPR